jgi:hypothetical protein
VASYTCYINQIYLQVVTAIREFIQAVDNYKKITHLSMEDREHLLELQCKSAFILQKRKLYLVLESLFIILCVNMIFD